MFKKWLAENKLLMENTWGISAPRRAHVLFSAECAEKALPLFERQFPHDDRPRKAVEAAMQHGLNKKSISRNIVADAHNAVTEAAAAAFPRGVYLDAAARAAIESSPIYAAYMSASAAHSAAAAHSGASSRATYATGINFKPLEQKVVGPNVQFSPSWKTDHTLGIAKQIWQMRQLGNLPVLADALEEAGVPTELVQYMRTDSEQTIADWFLWNLNFR